MALIIAMQNRSNLAEVSDYTVDVYVNERQIAGPFHVKGHRRDNGWEALVQQWAKTLKPKKFTPTQ